MIFNNNTTSLGASRIPMAEGYDTSCGAALALVESAQNDYKMFRAMLEVDAHECAIKRQSTGYVTEGEIMALSESTLSGIWEKIKEFFKKVAAKIKSIFHNFFIKFRGLYMNGKQLVKKYGNDVLRNSDILGKVEIKWRKIKNRTDLNSTTLMSEVPNVIGSVSEVDKIWDEDSDKRWDKYIKNTDRNNLVRTTVNNAADYREALEDYFWDDTEATKYDAKEIGVRTIVTDLEGYDKILKEAEKTAKKVTDSYEKLVQTADKMAKEAAGLKSDTANRGNLHFIGDTTKADNEYKNNFDDEGKLKDVTDGKTKDNVIEANITKANHTYDVAVVMSDASVAETGVVIQVHKAYYAQLKSAFVKLATANKNKLKESTIYLDAVEEAAAQEVEDVICGALSNEELSDLTNASSNVIDSDVSNDPSALTYGPDRYTKSVYYDRADGYKDSNINSNEESAFFGKLLY